MSTQDSSTLTPAQSSSFILNYPIFADNLNDDVYSVLTYLQLHMPLLSYEEITQWSAKHDILIDNAPANLEDPVLADQILTIVVHQHFEQKVDTQWHIVWQNDEIMAVYKPAPLAVSRTTRNLYDTLINLIRRQTPFYRAQLLHRLDIETSGLILIAKNKDSDVKYKKILKQLIEVKIYHAIVKGKPTWAEHLCTNELAEKNDSDIRCKMYVVNPLELREHYKKPKESQTLFKFIESSGDYSLIECQLFTGRKHQIRAQLADLDLPIVGDKIYNHDGHFFLKRLAHVQGLDEGDYEVLGTKNHLLKAVKIGLRLHLDEPLIDIECEGLSQELNKLNIEH